jgi:hypothetical protein
MINKIEILRAITFDVDYTKNLQNEDFKFTDQEIDFMIQFKMIYEIGEEQLIKFLDLLEEKGDELDEYSIQYYVRQLSVGPLKGILAPYLIKEDGSVRKYFAKKPDSMGVLGNFERTIHNTSIMEGYALPIGLPVDVINKTPPYITSISDTATDIVERMFKSSLASSTIIDNTLPLVDKDPQNRYFKESTGDIVKEAHGNHMVKDVYYLENTAPIKSQIFEKVEEYLGEEEFEIYKFNKIYNPFNPSKNDSITTKQIFEVESAEVFYDFEENSFMTYNGNLKESIVAKKIQTDMFGNEYDSDLKRARIYKIPNMVDDKEYLLNSGVGTDEYDGQLS